MSILNTIKSILPHRLMVLIRKLRVQYPYKEYMHRHRCIFVHIPKVAGTSIVTCLGGDAVNRTHVKAEVYKTFDPRVFEAYYKFAFVRNPWDRVVSTYKYWIQGFDQTNLFYQKLLKREYDTFEKFVLHFLNEDTIWMHLILRPQYSYMYDYRGEMLVDYVGKYESIENDCKEVLSKLNIDVPLKKVNSSKYSSYLDYYTSKELVDKVATLYRKDIELFDYKTMAPLKGNA